MRMNPRSQYLPQKNMENARVIDETILRTVRSCINFHYDNTSPESLESDQTKINLKHVPGM